MPESPLFKVPLITGGSDYPTPDTAADAKNVNDGFIYAEQFWGVKLVTSGTLPSNPKVQQLIFETDTGILKGWDGDEWLALSTGTGGGGGGPDAGSVSARNAKYPAPSTLSARITQQRLGVTWYLVEGNLCAKQIYLAEYDASLNPNGPTSGAGWYIVEWLTTPKTNSKSKLIDSIESGPFGTSTTEQVKATLTINLPHASKVYCKATVEWSSGINAAGRDYLKITNVSGQEIDSFRSHNNSQPAMAHVFLDGWVYLPSGSNAIVVSSQHESAGNTRSINVINIEAWAP